MLTITFIPVSSYRTAICGLKKTLLVIVAATLLTAALTTPVEASPTRLISHRTVLETGADGDIPEKGFERDSKRPSVSSDGKWIVFESDADMFFSGGDDNGHKDIYLHDVELGYTVRLTYGTDGKAANGGSYSPKISPNGKWIVFWSDASNLVPSDTNSESDVFRVKRPVIDVDGATISYSTERASVKGANTQLAAPSFNGSIADDGTVAFYTEAAIDSKDGNDTQDVYLRSAPDQVKKTKLISAKIDGNAGNSISFMPQISGDGKKIAYSSMATDLVAGNKCKQSICFDAYVVDLASSNTTLISKSVDAQGANGWSIADSISYSGSVVGIWSSADNLVGGLPVGNTGRAYMWKGGQVSLITSDKSYSVAVSANDGNVDGRYVALIKKNQLGTESAYLKDTQTNEMKLVSKDATGNAVEARHPTVSGDGSYVAFDSNATALKENYLGQGLYMWGELLIDIKNGIKLCGESGNKKECWGVYIRNMKSDTEPGPYQPDEAIMEPLVKVERSSEKAGAATDLTIKLKRRYDYHEFEKTEFHLPTGIGANTNVATCILAQAKKNTCPENTKVGKLHADIVMANNLLNLPPQYYKEVEDGGVDGGVYFCEPDAGEAAKLCAIAYDKYLMKEPIVVELDITLEKSSHYRMKVNSSAIPNSIDSILTNNAGPVPLGIVYPNITGIEFKIFGDGAGNTTNGHPFIKNSTFEDVDPEISADEKKFLAEISNWGKTVSKRDIPYQVEGAGSLSLSPDVSIDLSPGKAGKAADMAIKLDKATTDADLRKVETTLPKGIWVNGSAKVEFCEKDDSVAGKCGKPGGSGKSVGSVLAKSPLVSDLAGNVFLVDGAKPGDPMEMAVQLEQKVGQQGKIEIGFSCSMKLDQSKRINVVCNDLPPYTVTGFELKVNDLLTTNGVTCGSGTAELSSDTTITAWAKEIAPVSLKPKVSVNSDCTGAAQSSFAPKLSVTSDNHTVGASPGNLALSVKKDPADDPLTDLDLTLPHGMVGDLSATATKCTVAQAEGSGCPSSSKIGSVKATAQIFVGKTIQVEGGLFNATPGTGEFGRFIAAFDLPEIAGGEKLVLKSGVNPINNAQAIVTSVAGAPPEFNITDIRMNLHGKTASDAEGPLLMNPTFASTGSFTLDATSANEQKAKSTAPYPVSGTLGFAPHLNASLSTIKPGAEPVITTEIAQPVSETAMKEMRLSFQGFDLDITKGLTGCSSLEASFNACPPDSKLADVKAHSWVIPTPLEGALYLGEGAKSAFMTLNGPIALAVNGDIDIDAVKGSVSVNIDQGLPPISGSRIAATVGKGLFKVPSKTKPLKIALNTTSYANQTSSESVCVANCVSVEGNKGIKFSAKLKPTRQSSSADALFTVLHKDKKVSQPIKNLTVGLGRTKKTSLKFSRKRLKRLTRKRSARRRGASFGRLTLTPTKGKSFKFTLRAKKTGTLRVSANRAQKRRYIKAVSKAKKRYREAKGKKRKSAKKSYTRAKKNLSAYRRFERQITKKIKGKLQSRKLTVTRIPESIRISSKTLKFKRVMVRLAGKRGGVLKNPKVKKVTFSATSKPYKGSSMKAKSTVKLSQAKRAKNRK